MKILEKRVELGDKKFRIATDRNIAIKSFEAYPDVIEYIMKSQYDTKADDQEVFLNAIKNGELGKLCQMNEKLADLVKFVLPLMLSKANETLDAKSIIDYAEENEVIEEFNSAIVEFLFMGFTQGGLGKPKIKFSMS